MDGNNSTNSTTEVVDEDNKYRMRHVFPMDSVFWSIDGGHELYKCLIDRNEGDSYTIFLDALSIAVSWLCSGTSKEILRELGQEVINNEGVENFAARSEWTLDQCVERFTGWLEEGKTPKIWFVDLEDRNGSPTLGTAGFRILFGKVEKVGGPHEWKPKRHVEIEIARSVCNPSRCVHHLLVYLVLTVWEQLMIGLEKAIETARTRMDQLSIEQMNMHQFILACTLAHELVHCFRYFMSTGGRVEWWRCRTPETMTFPDMESPADEAGTSSSGEAGYFWEWKFHGGIVIVHSEGDFLLLKEDWEWYDICPDSIRNFLNLGTCYLRCRYCRTEANIR